MTPNIKDMAAGLFFLFVGVLYGSLAWMTLSVGSALNMGPGYFPLILSVALCLFGIAICAKSFFETSGRLPFGDVPWRGVAALSLATLIFAGCVENLGLFPTVFVTTFIAGLAKPGARLGAIILTSLGIAIFCTLIFSYGVRLPLPVVGDWLTW